MMSAKSLRKKYQREKEARVAFERTLPIIQCWTDKEGVFHMEEVARLIK